MDKPYYSKAAIGSISTLAEILGMSETTLQNLAGSTKKNYLSFTLVNSKTLKERLINNPSFPLKIVQKKINSRIFTHIKFPIYLQGGLKSDTNTDRNYIHNAQIHCKPKTLITLDIENFYPNISKHHVKGIFCNVFKVPSKVANILTELTTLDGSVPQGGCTSSYLANLALYNSEYSIVSYLRGKNINYSRLIDDITISSSQILEQKECEKIIQQVAAMLKKNGFNLKNSKTKILSNSHANTDFNVTGLWVKHGIPKLPRTDRKFIRLLVYTCEQKASQDMESDEYHKLWNQASGAVAQLQQLNHSQAFKLRERLSKILPKYSAAKIHQIKQQTNKLLKLPSLQTINLNKKRINIQRVNKLLFKINIVARTQPNTAKKLRSQLSAHFGDTKVMKKIWEE